MVLSQRGFSLLETIIAIVVGGIVGVMFVQYMGTGLTGSSVPVVRTVDHYSLAEAADRVTAVYRKAVVTTDTPLATLKSLIDGGSLLDAGSFTSSTKYMAFDPTTLTEKEASEGDRILKVSITNTQDNQTVTMLFTD